MKLKEDNLLLKIYKIETPIENEYNPAVLNVNSHNIDPIWVGGVLYAVLAKYIDSLPENIQNEFQEASLEYFNKFVDVGMEHITNHKIKQN